MTTTRTYTTPAMLDALPTGSTLTHSRGAVLVKLDDGNWAPKLHLFPVYKSSDLTEEYTIERTT